MGQKAKETGTKVPRRPVVKAPPLGFDDDGALEGLTDVQRSEAIALKAKIAAFPRRPAARMERRDEARALVIGSQPGTETLHSIRMFETLAAGSNEFCSDTVRRIGSAVHLTGRDQVDGEIVSGAFAVIAAIAPQNELETTMAVQMIAANEAVLMCFERSRTAQSIEHAAAYSNMANKAMRSFALHAEAIAKLRRGGEQVVKHVHVNEGGQAVIAGTVNTGRGV